MPATSKSHNAAFSSNDRKSKQTMTVYLSAPAFRAVWILMMLTRVGCVFFLVSLTGLYVFMTHPYMTYYADLLGPGVTSRFHIFGILFSTVAVAHTYQALRILIYSIRKRHLILDIAQDYRDTLTNKNAIFPSITASISGNKRTFPKVNRHRKSTVDIIQDFRRFTVNAIPPSIQQSASVGWRTVFTRRGFFGVDSDFFHLRFLLREIFEYVSQTVQVYRSSVLIAQLLVNHLYVAIMVTNCWTTPLLQRALAHLPATERLVCLSVDLILDILACMVLPMIIFAPYYQNFNLETYNFDTAHLYDDAWFPSMVLENKQIFALSVADFIFKFIPHLGIFTCLNDISALIRPMPPEITPYPNAHRKMGSNGKQGTRTVLTANNHLVRFGMSLSHIILITWGAIVLTLHLIATQTSQNLDVPACKQAIRPWFAKKYACSVFHFNCYANGSTGISEDALDFLEEESVTALVISHCPQLTVPKSIRSFRNLLGIDFFNSTIIEWDAEAAITNTTHSAITYIIFVMVNMSQLPNGILEPLPATMKDLEISVSNLTSLPVDLHERWHSMGVMYVEHAQLTEFPSALEYLQVDDLSLVGNKIETLPKFPSDERQRARFTSLALTLNPLRSIPEPLGDMRDFRLLSIDSTQIETFSPWIEQLTQTAVKIYAANTPFCLHMTEYERVKQYGVNAVLTCSDTNDYDDGKYPLALMIPKRPLTYT